MAMLEGILATTLKTSRERFPRLKSDLPMCSSPAEASHPPWMAYPGAGKIPLLLFEPPGCGTFGPKIQNPRIHY
jgi:hypothetical protein